MEIKQLLELCCAKCGSLIRKLPIQGIRDFFGVENDFTPEEEAQIKEETKWMDEP